MTLNISDPNRAKYRKTIGETKKCPFCDKKNISAQGCPSLFGKHWLVLTNKYPYLDGNLMIIPRRHVKDISNLNLGEWQELWEILNQTKNKLEKIFKTNDFNIALNLGRNAGASIEHLHWQIVPRREKIANALNIFADIQVITVLPQELKKLIEK